MKRFKFIKRRQQSAPPASAAAPSTPEAQTPPPNFEAESPTKKPTTPRAPSTPDLTRQESCSVASSHDLSPSPHRNTGEGQDSVFTPEHITAQSKGPETPTKKGDSFGIISDSESQGSSSNSYEQRSSLTSSIQSSVHNPWSEAANDPRTPASSVSDFGQPRAETDSEAGFSPSSSSDSDASPRRKKALDSPLVSPVTSPVSPAPQASNQFTRSGLSSPSSASDTSAPENMVATSKLSQRTSPQVVVSPLSEALSSPQENAANAQESPSFASEELSEDKDGEGSVVEHSLSQTPQESPVSEASASSQFFSYGTNFSPSRESDVSAGDHKVATPVEAVVSPQATPQGTPVSAPASPQFFSYSGPNTSATLSSDSDEEKEVQQTIQVSPRQTPVVSPVSHVTASPPYFSDATKSSRSQDSDLSSGEHVVVSQVSPRASFSYDTPEPSVETQSSRDSDISSIKNNSWQTAAKNAESRVSPVEANMSPKSPQESAPVGRVSIISSVVSSTATPVDEEARNSFSAVSDSMGRSTEDEESFPADDISKAEIADAEGAEDAWPKESLPASSSFENTTLVCKATLVDKEARSSFSSASDSVRYAAEDEVVLPAPADDISGADIGHAQDAKKEKNSTRPLKAEDNWEQESLSSSSSFEASPEETQEDLALENFQQQSISPTKAPIDTMIATAEQSRKDSSDSSFLSLDDSLQGESETQLHTRDSFSSSNLSLDDDSDFTSGHDGARNSAYSMLSSETSTSSKAEATTYEPNASSQASSRVQAASAIELVKQDASVVVKATADESTFPPQSQAIARAQSDNVIQPPAGLDRSASSASIYQASRKRQSFDIDDICGPLPKPSADDARSCSSWEVVSDLDKLRTEDFKDTISKKVLKLQHRLERGEDVTAKEHPRTQAIVLQQSTVSTLDADPHAKSNEELNEFYDRMPSFTSSVLSIEVPSPELATRKAIEEQQYKEADSGESLDDISLLALSSEGNPRSGVRPSRSSAGAFSDLSESVASEKRNSHGSSNYSDLHDDRSSSSCSDNFRGSTQSSAARSSGRHDIYEGSVYSISPRQSRGRSLGEADVYEDSVRSEPRVSATSATARKYMTPGILVARNSDASSIATPSQYSKYEDSICTESNASPRVTSKTTHSSKADAVARESNVSSIDWQGPPAAVGASTRSGSRIRPSASVSRLSRQSTSTHGDIYAGSKYSRSMRKTPSLADSSIYDDSLYSQMVSPSKKAQDVSACRQKSRRQMTRSDIYDGSLDSDISSEELCRSKRDARRRSHGDRSSRSRYLAEAESSHASDALEPPIPEIHVDHFSFESRDFFSEKDQSPEPQAHAQELPKPRPEVQLVNPYDRVLSPSQEQGLTDGGEYFSRTEIAEHVNAHARTNLVNFFACGGVPVGVIISCIGAIAFQVTATTKLHKSFGFFEEKGTHQLLNFDNLYGTQIGVLSSGSSGLTIVATIAITSIMILCLILWSELVRNRARYMDKCVVSAYVVIGTLVVCTIGCGIAATGTSAFLMMVYFLTRMCEFEVGDADLRKFFEVASESQMVKGEAYFTDEDMADFCEVLPTRFREAQATFIYSVLGVFFMAATVFTAYQNVRFVHNYLSLHSQAANTATTRIRKSTAGATRA